MNATIVPTVLANNVDEYRRQIESVEHFARRIHIDLADGHFAPTKTVGIDDIWWRREMHADLHVMYKRPFDYAHRLLQLQPKLIIVHAEAEGDFAAFADLAHKSGVQVGVALKPETKPQVIAQALDFIDHVLIFSGNLGHFGGQANTHLLVKVLHLKQLKPSLEIGWDGGINDKNAATLAAGGVDVLNVGGYIQHAASPAAAFKELESALQTHKRH
jgi:ribulose-phosphate 3-epimerase